ncbi:hypothetical protein PQX77_002952 [Marasmius sp. AFHP31]|nr:hypothetical protein PQX77_002952 [Marasmius sp. AFHP31]
MSHTPEASSISRSYIDPPQGFKFVTKLEQPQHVGRAGPIGGFAEPSSGGTIISGRPVCRFIGPSLDSGQKRYPMRSVTNSQGQDDRCRTFGHGSNAGCAIFWKLTLAVLICFSGYLCWLDVGLSVVQLQKAIQFEAESCQHRYAENNCNQPLEMIEELCLAWRVCMEREPADIHILQVAASRVALIIGSFADTLSLKASVSTLSFSIQRMITVLLMLLNPNSSLLGFYWLL